LFPKQKDRLLGRIENHAAIMTGGQMFLSLSRQHRLSSPQLDDSALIDLITQKNAAALGEIYDRYHRLVFSVALNVVGRREDAEEITLDVFTRVWEKAATYRSERAKASTWLTPTATVTSTPSPTTDATPSSTYTPTPTVEATVTTSYGK
jgi:hypothetical protein